MPPRLRYRSTQPHTVSCCPTSPAPTVPQPWLRAGHVSPGSNSELAVLALTAASAADGSAARLLAAEENYVRSVARPFLRSRNSF